METAGARQMTTAPHTQSVRAVERALQILEHLARSRHGVSLSQVTRALHLPRSTTHALLLTFERCGYVQRDTASGRYRLGLRLYELANMALSGISLRDQAAPVLHNLMEETGLIVHLAILEQGEAVLLEKLEPPGAPKVATWVGKHIAFHCTAAGKALVALLPDAELERLVKKQGLLRYNENTISTFSRLRQECARIRACGYTVDDEEEEIGIRCVGAPLLDWQHQVVGAISVVGTTDRVTNVAAVAAKVLESALAISRRLGYSGGTPGPAAGEDVPQ